MARLLVIFTLALAIVLIEVSANFMEAKHPPWPPRPGKRDCPLGMCRMHCKYGFQEVNGCPICKCNECPNVMCAMYCPNGFQKGDDGCDICKCAPARRALCMECRMACPQGEDFP